MHDRHYQLQQSGVYHLLDSGRVGTGIRAFTADIENVPREYRCISAEGEFEGENGNITVDGNNLNRLLDSRPYLSTGLDGSLHHSLHEPG